MSAFSRLATAAIAVALGTTAAHGLQQAVGPGVRLETFFFPYLPLILIF